MVGNLLHQACGGSTVRFGLQTTALARPLAMPTPRVSKTARKALAVEAPPIQRADRPATVREGPIIINGQVAHSLTSERLEIVESMGPYLETSVAPWLRGPNECWKPSDFLPSSDSPDFFDEVRELRERTKELPDEYFVVLVGDMITEEALPTYMAMLNTLDGVRDETGASQTPWAQWTRKWVAEEKRHGDVLNKYCWLSGRVNMGAVEKTVQNLITTGMDPKTENNPYLGFLFTSFQERATFVCHCNTARQAYQHGDRVLAKLCGSIAADEKRHEHAYQAIMEELFRVDPSGAMLAFHNMMKKQITMPAHLMDDSEHKAKTGRTLFADYSSVADNIGVYTPSDYLDIIEYLIRHWDIPSITGLNPEAAKAQDELCTLPARYRRLAERAAKKSQSKPKVQTRFSWIFDRPLDILSTK